MSAAIEKRIADLEAVVRRLHCDLTSARADLARLAPPSWTGKARPRERVMRKAALILDHVAKAYGVDPSVLRGRRGTATISEARSVAMHLAKKLAKASNLEAAALVNRVPSNAQKMIAKIGWTIRETPLFAEWVGEIETDCKAGIDRQERGAR